MRLANRQIDRVIRNLHLFTIIKIHIVSLNLSYHNVAQPNWKCTNMSNQFLWHSIRAGGGGQLMPVHASFLFAAVKVSYISWRAGKASYSFLASPQRWEESQRPEDWGLVCQPELSVPHVEGLLVHIKGRPKDRISNHGHHANQSPLLIIYCGGWVHEYAALAYANSCILVLCSDWSIWVLLLSNDRLARH